MKFKFILFIFMLVTGLVSFGQMNDSTKPADKVYKNIIRYNLGSALIFNFDKAIIFGYERVISPRQSFSINMGKTGLGGGRESNDSITQPKNLKSSGFNLSADYRFYLAKENKYPAPHGVYIGPYYSFNHFLRENTLSYLQPNGSSLGVDTKVDFTVHTVGMELGYQFVLWKRLALDFVVVGPGIGSYKFETSIEDNLTPEQKQKVQDAIIKALEKYPGLGNILDRHPLNSEGSFNTTDLGFRYLIHIGFLF